MYFCVCDFSALPDFFFFLNTVHLPDHVKHEIFHFISFGEHRYSFSDFINCVKVIKFINIL